MIANVLIAVGIVLVGFGVYALFKLQGKESETTIGVGSLKIATKSPALALIVLGLLCVAGRFVSAEEGSVAARALPNDAVASYIAMVNAYNGRDTARYYGAFKRPMECFYSVGNAEIEGKRPELTSRLQVDGRDLSALEVTPTRVEFCDRGFWVNENSIRRQHHKIIVMEKHGTDWLVTVETAPDAMGCYASRYASQC